jgi:hypothetical protein
MSTEKCPRCGYYGLIHDQSGVYCFDCDYRVSKDPFIGSSYRESWDECDEDGEEY